MSEQATRSHVLAEAWWRRSRATAHLVRWLVCILGALAAASPARAQDFESAGNPHTGGLARLLEHALPWSDGGWHAEATGIQRFGTPELTTRALAVGLGARALQVAAGLSQTGDPEIGWTTVALGLGAAGRAHGAAIRALARRDRHPIPRETPLGAGLGVTAGAGAWLRPARAITLHASAPALWSRGAEAPLARGLTLGVAWAGPGADLWLEHEARPEAGWDAASHAAGIRVAVQPISAWIAARDGPLRGAIGIAAETPFFQVLAEAESHPVLPETLKLTLRTPTRAWR